METTISTPPELLALVGQVVPPGFKFRTESKPGDGHLEVMYYGGDWKGIWNPSNPDEVDACRTTFEALRKKGFLAYKLLDNNEDKGEQLHVFDPKAGRIIMAPPLRGG